MILSQTAIYAVKAALHLAEAHPQEPVRVDDIAAALGVPRNYLSKILHALARSGLLESTRGPRGGFVLAEPPDRITLERVIGPFDDIATTSGCLLGRSTCSDERPCAAHARWRGVSEALHEFLTHTTLLDLSENGAPVDGLPPGTADGRTGEEESQ